MSEYEKELAYVKKLFNESIIPDQLNNAKRVKQLFVDKYVILISPTDKTFLKVIDDLNKLEREKLTRITSAYLFNKK